MLFAAPPAPPPIEPTTLTQVAPLPAGYHNQRLTGAPAIWSLKGNPKALLDDQSFRFPPDQKQP
jgi:hypothetical protein